MIHTEAICHRCGASKKGPFVPCKGCQHQPRGDGRAVAWLFSRAWLDEDELEAAARRVRSGEQPDVPRHLIVHARTSMGAISTDQSQHPLTLWQLLGIATANLLLTPLTGMAVWYGLREDRPMAARQSLRVTLPIALGLAVFWMSLLLGQLIQ